MLFLKADYHNHKWILQPSLKLLKYRKAMSVFSTCSSQLLFCSFIATWSSHFLRATMKAARLVFWCSHHVAFLFWSLWVLCLNSFKMPSMYVNRGRSRVLREGGPTSIHLCEKVHYYTLKSIMHGQLPKPWVSLTEPDPLPDKPEVLHWHD